MLKCLISWNPRLRLCYHGEVDPSSPCGSPSRYAAQTLRCNHLATARKFTLAQLSAATGGFCESNLVGEGGFGRVYRGRLDDPDSDEELEVAVKQLCRGGAQGSREFLVESSMLMMLRRHPNLVSLVGYGKSFDVSGG